MNWLEACKSELGRAVRINRKGERIYRDSRGAWKMKGDIVIMVHPQDVDGYVDWFALTPQIIRGENQWKKKKA